MGNHSTLQKTAYLLWGLVLLTLPVTSFRYFPGMGEGTFVRPLAFYPLVVLILVLLIQLLRRTTPWPHSGTLTPLAAFLLVAAATTLIGILFNPIALRGQGIIGREQRAWLTVIIGLLFFVAAVWMNRSESDLRYTVQWLLTGFVLTLLWSGLQASTFYTPFLKKEIVTHWQLLFSMRELVRTNRISGLAYEPAWLAGQIATVYMPWLFAALLTGHRITRLKWLEPILLLIAVLMLLATYSRGGMLQAGAAAGLTFLIAGSRNVRSVWMWFSSGFGNLTGWMIRVGVLLVAAASITGALLFLNQKGYIARLWSTQAESLEEFAIENSAGARAAYSAAAMAAYRDHPWTGVGLGASGFYIYPNLPDWALTTVPEIARQLSPDNHLYPNPKNLYVRLLAETGLVGFFLFIAFQFSVLGDALAGLRSKFLILQFLGSAGLFSWLALSIYNLTQDSFATPNLWINLGVLVGITGSVMPSVSSTKEIQ